MKKEKDKKEQDDLEVMLRETEEESGSYMALGTLIGFVVATIAGYYLLDTIAYGPMGMALGMALGMCIRKEK